jgi:SNF2 family DNA or RNA helicase
VKEALPQNKASLGMRVVVPDLTVLFYFRGNMDFLVPPWQHQLKGFELAKEKTHFAFFFEMGTGKTSTVINVVRHRFATEGRILNTLVLAPIITLTNWRAEFLRYSKIKDENLVVLKGSQTQRIDQIVNSQGPKIFITNYEAMAVMPGLHSCLMHNNMEILICDESHKCKDMKSKRTQKVIELADRARFRYLLSGTPVLNTPMDIFAQYRIMDQGETFGKNVWSFRAQYFYDKNAGIPKERYFPDWKVRPGALDEMNRLIYEKAMRVTKEECMDLPPMVQQTIHVEMLPEQKKAYEEMKKQFVTYINDKACVATLALTKALRLQQIVSGFIKLEDGTEIKMKKSPRQEALKDLLETLTPDHKVLVWAVFKENYAQIRAVCDELKIKYVEVHGDIPNAEKFRNVDTFNNDRDVRVFLGHPGSGGIGINLVSATYSIFYSRSFSLEQSLQAEARNHRGGQTQKVTRIDLVTPDTIDEIVLKKLASKEELGEKLLSDLKTLWDGVKNGTVNNSRRIAELVR